MVESVESMLPYVRADFEQVSKERCRHFYCPILRRDEPGIELCAGHIVNKAIKGSSQAVAVQRKDVDGWYGAHFESDFAALSEIKQRDIAGCLSEPKLWSRLDPEFRIDDQVIPHYFSKSPLPPHHAEGFVRQDDGSEKRIAFKVSPEELNAAGDASMSVSVNRDFSLFAVVSLIKAAHLTLFKRLGYTYALCASGYQTARLLGDFYTDNCHRTKTEIIANAKSHFRQGINIVRPVSHLSSGLQGSVDDGVFHLALSLGVPWAVVVFIRTGPQVHAVLMPAYGTPDICAVYERFYQKAATQITVTPARHHNRQWDFNPKQLFTCAWPGEAAE